MDTQTATPEMSIVERKVVKQRHTILSLLNANRRLKLRIAALERQQKLNPSIPPEDLAYALRMTSALTAAAVDNE